MVSMNTMLESDVADPTLFKRFENFTTPVLVNSTKKGFTPPEHHFFLLCDKHAEYAEQLRSCFDNRILQLQISFLSYLNQELISRKNQGQLF